MKKLLLLLLLSLFIFSACKDDDEPEQEQVTPTTFVKEETEIVAVNDNTITLTGNQTEIETSDIIVSGANGNAPNGFLRKVVSVSTSNGNTILQTQRTTVGEAVKYYFEEGEEHQDNFSYTFSDDDIAGRSPSGTNTTPISIDIDETITADQGGVPIDLNITGNLTITPSIIGNIKLSRHNLSPVFEEFVFSISTENEFNITLNSELSLGFDTGDIRLGRFEGAPITVFVGIPIVIRPQFTLYIGSNGNLTANIIYTYNNNSTAFAGVTYDDGWQYLPNNGFTIDSQSSTATASVTGNLKAYVKPEFSLALYDNSVVSAGISVEPYARFEGAISSTEYSWSVNGGIDTGAYFKAFDFGFTTLIDETWENLIEIPEWEIASGFYNIATITNPIPTDNSTISTQPINFSWQPNDFTISPTYEILFGTDINSLTSIGTTNNTNFTHPNNSLNDDTYYWKIRANDGNGDIITESLFFSFILDTSSTNISPAHTPNPTNTSTDIAINGNLSFSEGTNTPSDATYKLYFDTSSNPSTIFTLAAGITSYNYTNLQNGTSYYWKVETISNSGSVLATSPIWNFTTLSNNSIPTVTTTAITNITQTTATSGGDVTNEGGSNVTEKGVVWSTTPNPTITDNPTTDGTGIGSFTSSLTGLTENTIYYVKAYATNSFGTGFGTEMQFTTLNNGSGGVYNGDVTLLTQQEVNNFGANNYNSINGNLTIGFYQSASTTNINNLSPLQSITTISGNLKIKDNGNLTNLIGLNNIQSVGNDLVIQYNDNLENLNGLENLNSEINWLFIYLNPNLTTLDGIQNISSVNDLSITENLILSNTSALNNLTYSNDVGILIRDNNLISNIDFLSNITTAAGIQLINNQSLNNISGLSNLVSVTEYQLDLNNIPITNLLDFSNLTSLVNLEINDLPNLTNLNGFENLTSCPRISINNNNNLLNINALSNIASFMEALSIFNNSNLTNLNGLSGITNVDWLSVQNNNSITNLNGLQNITSINDLSIKTNINLTNFCDISNLIINNGLSGDYYVSNNLYNPTQQDIIDGNCSQ